MLASDSMDPIDSLKDISDDGVPVMVGVEGIRTPDFNGVAMAAA